MWQLPSPMACAGLALATRAAPASFERAFSSYERMWEAFGRDELSLDATVRVARRATTVGRHLVAACLPPPFADRVGDAPWGARTVATVLSAITRELHVELAARAALALDALGAFVIQRSGFSPKIDDFAPPRARSEIRRGVYERVRRVACEYYEAALITDGERYNKTIDLWGEAAELERDAARKEAPAGDPLAVMGASAVPPVNAEMRRAMRGLIAHRYGEIAERPVLHNVGDGFDAHDAALVWSALRRQVLAQDERDVVVSTLLHDLHAVLCDTVVVARDCGTRRGVRLSALELPCGETLEALSTRIEGRVLAAEVSTRDGQTLADEGTLISAALARSIEAARIPWVMVRDVQTCEAKGGVCARCAGLSVDDATWMEPGAPMGARAAIGIAKELRRFDTREFHIC